MKAAAIALVVAALGLQSAPGLAQSTQGGAGGAGMKAGGTGPGGDAGGDQGGEVRPKGNKGAAPGGERTGEPGTGKQPADQGGGEKKLPQGAGSGEKKPPQGEAGGKGGTRSGARLDDAQRGQAREAFHAASVKRVANIGVDIAVGVAVPRTIVLNPLPPTIVEIVPEYRRYRFVAVEGRILIVDPVTFEIVDVIPD